MTDDGVPDLDLTSERDGADPFADDAPGGDGAASDAGSDPSDSSEPSDEPESSGTDPEADVTDISPPD
ncbi:segregation/condensation protein A, partial [Halorubrum sp. SS5]